LACHLCAESKWSAEEFLFGHTLSISRWKREIDRAQLVIHVIAANLRSITFFLSSNWNLRQKSVATIHSVEKCRIPQVEHFAASFWKFR